MTLRTVLVIIHASAGVAGLLVGLPSLAPDPATSRTWLRRLYAACIAVLLASMVSMIAVDWGQLETGARIAFGGLAGLGAVMVYRLRCAHREARVQDVGWQLRYIGHVYFTYISLWVGFLIVPALNLPSPQLAAPLVVAATLTTGHMLIARYQRRVLGAALGPRRPQPHDVRG